MTFDLRNVGYIDAVWEGAVGDGEADDTDALQAAIDLSGSTAAMRSGNLLIPAARFKISDTILLQAKSLNIEASGAVFVWAGPAGIPMMRLRDCYMTHIRGLRFKGDPAARPSAAVSMYNVTGDPQGTSFNTLEDVIIGRYEWDSDFNGTDQQFVNGVSWDGDNLNGDRNTLRNIRMVGLTGNGVDISHSNNINNFCQSVHVRDSAIPFRLGANTHLENCQVAESATTDIYADGTANVTVEQFTSELSARFIQQRTSAWVDVTGGYWQASPNIASGGVFIDAVDNTRTATVLRNYQLTASTSYAGPTPLIAVHASPAGATHKLLGLDNVRGFISSPAVAFTASNLDTTPATGGDEIVKYGRFLDIASSTWTTL